METFARKTKKRKWYTRAVPPECRNTNTATVRSAYHSPLANGFEYSTRNICDVNIQPVEAQMASALQQFKFMAARLAPTTTSLDDIRGSSQSSGSEEGSSTRTSVQLALDLHLQQMHWTSGLSRSISITSLLQLYRIYWLRLPRKLTSSGFSLSVGFWQQDAGIGWTHPLKCAHT